jgi:hypothetical protein
MDLNFQYAHNSHDESETKKNITANEAAKAFDEFDWLGEAEKANELQKCSPTLSVVIDGSNELAWVSAFSDRNGVQFVSESRFPGEVKKWLGLSKGQGVVSLNAGSLCQSSARKVIELFAAKQYESLREIYKNA